MKARKSLLGVLLAAVVLGVTACGGFTEKDAKTYVKATLDASYKEEFKEYVKITDSTEKEAQKKYDEAIDNVMTETEIKDSGITEEIVNNYKELFKNMFKQAEYKVGNAKKGDGDDFTVDVAVKPYTTFDGVTDEVIALLQKEKNLPESEEEITKLIFEKMYDIMSKKLESPAFGDETTLTVHVKLNSDDQYEIPDEDMTAIDEAMFSLENF